MEVQQVPLVEPFVVQDTFVSGLHHIEDIGDGLFRFTFYVKQRSTYDGLGEERIVVARLVLSSTVILSAAKRALTAVGVRCCGAMRRMAVAH